MTQERTPHRRLPGYRPRFASVRCRLIAFALRLLPMPEHVD
jgi:hypothetical protein